MSVIPFECPKGWQMYRTVLYKKYQDPKPSKTLAIFDLDNTLMITPSYYIEELKRGSRIPPSKPLMPEDYCPFHPKERDKLLGEIKNGKGILIFSNQKGMMDNVPMAYVILERIGLLLEERLFIFEFIKILQWTSLYIFFWRLSRIFFGNRVHLYRLSQTHSAPGMLLLFEKHLNGGLEVDRANSFYVGDAAGRRLPYQQSSLMMRHTLENLRSRNYAYYNYYNISQDGRMLNVNLKELFKKMSVSRMTDRFSRDFSDCDLKFALNIGMKFLTPDNYFYDLPPYNFKVDFDPVLVGSDPFFPTVKGGLIVLIGNVSSGKTYICKNLAPNFERITESDFDSRSLFLEGLKQMLSERKDVIIDDTNHLVKPRKEMVTLARSLGIFVTFVHLDLSLNLVKHLYRFKKLASDENTYEYFQIPLEEPTRNKWSYLSTVKVQRPTLDEGPNVIYTITDSSFPMEQNKLMSIHLP